FDPTRIEAGSGSIQVLEGVRLAVSDSGAAFSQTNTSSSGEAQFSTSLTGTLAYLPGPTVTVRAPRDLALVDRDGTLERLKLPGGTYVHARMSPDGRRVAFVSETGKDSDVFVYTLGSGTSMSRRTFGGINRYPVWAGDKRIAFQS